MMNARWGMKWGLWVIGATWLLGSAHVWAQTECERLTNLHIQETTVESATEVEAGFFKAPGVSTTLRNLPHFCRVTGIIKPQVRFEVWLPLDKWTARFEVVGNGGMAGAIPYSAMAGALRRGNAAGGTDTGHVATPGQGFDSSWSLGEPELVEDFGHRALHVTTVHGKQIIAAFYGKAQKHSYYVGCSKGGGQG